MRADYNCSLQDQKYDTVIRKLIEEVKCLLSDTLNTHEMLELIDRLEKLGLAYLFEHEIKKASNQNFNAEKNLYATALWFLILRKHGYHVSQGIHMLITCEVRTQTKYVMVIVRSVKFITHLFVINYVWCIFLLTDVFTGLVDISTESDVKAVLKLFEASHLSFEGEHILEKAYEVSKEYLESMISSKQVDSSTPKIIYHTLEDPYNVWFNVKTHIQFCEENTNSNDSHLVDLAKHNFNMLQALYKKEVKELARYVYEQNNFNKSPK